MTTKNTVQIDPTKLCDLLIADLERKQEATLDHIRSLHPKLKGDEAEIPCIAAGLGTIFQQQILSELKRAFRAVKFPS
jgi:hypothetical protein